MSTPSFPAMSGMNGAPASALDPYRRAVRRHPVLVVLVVLVTIAAAVAWTQTRSHEYEATAQILVTPQADNTATSGLPILSESVDPTRTLQTASTILTSPRALALAAKQLGDGWTIQRLRDSLMVEPQGNANIVGVTGTAASAAAAARIANAYADAALEARATTLRTQVDQKLAGIESRQDAITDPASAAAAALADEAGTLQAIRDGQDPNFSMLQSAEPPASATGTSSVLIIILAAFVGMVLGVAAALAVEQISRRVRDEEELTELAPLPVLARVPIDRRHQDWSITPPSGAIEALRALQIQLESRGRGSRAVVVTSASEGDGKTTTAIALANTLVSAGRRVILLDFDLRKSEVGERLGVRSDLLHMLRNDNDLEDVLVNPEGMRALSVLSAPPVGDAGALFQAYSRRLPELIEQARALADFVIIDTPPLGRVADALRLMAKADDLLLVSRPGHTDRRELKLAQEMLGHLGIIPTGLVLVGGVRRTARYYGFTGGDALTALAPRDTPPVTRLKRNEAKDSSGALPSARSTVG